MAEHRLREVGYILYGPGWKAGLMEALEVDAATVERWDRNNALVPPQAWRRLARLLMQRGDALTRVAEEKEREERRRAVDARRRRGTIH